MDVKKLNIRTWRDRGGNLGIQCLDCNRVHWTGDEPTHDPTNPNIQCETCVEIKASNVKNEKAIEHQVEVSEFQKKVEQVRVLNEKEKDKKKHIKNPDFKEFCKHPMSQPIETR